jgi:hypothetical protein
MENNTPSPPTANHSTRQQQQKQESDKSLTQHATLASKLRKHAIHSAQDMSINLGHFRQQYGLKMVPPYMVQANGVACFILLTDLSTDSPSFSSSTMAFKEAFRCLLGMGMQLLWARAMARLLHLTAQKKGFKLPSSIEMMLSAVSESAWTANDKQRLSSCWPNYAIVGTAKVGESVMMEDLIREWEGLAVDRD